MTAQPWHLAGRGVLLSGRLTPKGVGILARDVALTVGARSRIKQLAAPGNG